MNSWTIPTREKSLSTSKVPEETLAGILNFEYLKESRKLQEESWKKIAEGTLKKQIKIFQNYIFEALQKELLEECKN